MPTGQHTGPLGRWTGQRKCEFINYLGGTMSRTWKAGDGGWGKTQSTKLPGRNLEMTVLGPPRPRPEVKQEAGRPREEVRLALPPRRGTEQAHFLPRGS